jgi:hypothetical protein
MRRPEELSPGDRAVVRRIELQRLPKKAAKFLFTEVALAAALSLFERLQVLPTVTHYSLWGGLGALLIWDSYSFDTHWWEVQDIQVFEPVETRMTLWTLLATHVLIVAGTASLIGMRH